MNPTRYLRPAMIQQRQRAMAWIARHRILRRSCYALAKLEHTPAHVAQQWANGNIPGAILQTAACFAIGFAIGAIFGLYV